VRAATVSPQARTGYVTPEEGLLARIPRTYPPFESFYVATDGSLWVKRILANREQGFDVFSANGAFLRRVTAPADFANARIQRITPDEIYATVPDSEGVYSVVVRFGIRRPAG
jgi:hypothetical protein